MSKKKINYQDFKKINYKDRIINSYEFYFLKNSLCCQEKKGFLISTKILASFFFFLYVCVDE